MTLAQFFDGVTGLSSRSRFMELLQHRWREDKETISDPAAAQAAIRQAVRG